MTPRVRLYACIEGARYGLKPEQVVGKSRQLFYVKARHAVMRRLDRDGFSAAQIGRWMDRDHTTVLHALGRLG